MLSSTQGKVFWYGLSVDEGEVDLLRGRVGISKLWPEGSFSIRCGVPVPRWMTYATRVKPTERCWMAALDWDAEEIDDENWHYYFSLPYWRLLVGSYGALWELRKARLLRGELGDA